MPIGVFGVNTRSFDTGRIHERIVTGTGPELCSRGESDGLTRRGSSLPEGLQLFVSVRLVHLKKTALSGWKAR